MITKIHKASPLGDAEVPDTEIRIDDCVKPIDMVLKKWILGESESLFEQEADRLEEALHGCLPQGTYHRLLYKMMGRRLSLYIGKTKE